MEEQTFIFGDSELGLYLYVSEIDRVVMPSRRFNRTSREGHDGEHVKALGLEALEIKVNVHLMKNEVLELAEMRRKLASLLFTDTAQKLILPDEPDRFYYAYYEGGADLDRLFRWPSCELTFLVPDPIAYGRERSTTVSTTAATIKTGGTYKSYPTVKVTTTAKEFTLTNVTTGDFVTVSTTSTASKAIIIDMEQQRVTVNGTDHPVTLDSDFFALEGTQQLKTSTGTATITWNERWL